MEDLLGRLRMVRTHVVVLGFVVGCGSSVSEPVPAPVPLPLPDPGPGTAAEPEPLAAAPDPGTGEGTGTATGTAAAPESCLGVDDTGVWSDLDDRVQLALPADLDRSRVTATISADGDTLVLHADGWPVKPYPLAGDTTLAVGDTTLALRAGDAAELAGLLTPTNLRRLDAGEATGFTDRDGDDIPDPLDVLIGGKKMALEAWEYGGQYITLDYPMGDLPRSMGVCTDVVIRAYRNAGLDLQQAVHVDIRQSKRSYPMVKKKRGDKNIDHRRVRTLLPWFRRHTERHAAAIDDPDDPLRPGDVIFMDTLSRSGPDHIGVLSDTIGESGFPLVINAWTNGYVTQEMDLLGWVPVTHRFRLR
jgi:uncharacterized protein YijF (DUF1287 family)